MLAPRWIAFLAALVASTAVHLSYARLLGLWERPKINEASEVLAYYFWIGHVFVVGLAVVAFIAFPQAVAADRLFQKKKKGRSAPYVLFCGVALLITGSLLATLSGERHALDFLLMPLYFSVAPIIV